MSFISVLGDNGYLFLILAVFFLPFKKLRKISYGLIICALLILVVNNLFLKKVISRDRPFITYPEFISNVLGELPTSDSFPSGHTAVNFAFATYLWCYKKKYKIFAIFATVFAVLVGFSRIYVIHHYFTDVMAGILVGAICGVGAYFLTHLVVKLFVKLRIIPNEE
jgi:undecaprenyl-diphosphatase